MRHDSRGVAFDDERICSILLEILELTEGASFRAGFEDFPRDGMALDFYADSLKSLVEHPRYGLLLDLGHMNFWLQSRPYYEGRTIEEYISDVPVSILELHLHDNDGTADQHLPLGKGNIDLNKIAAGLKKITFEGFCTLEITPGTEDSKTEVLKSLQLWKTAWEN